MERNNSVLISLIVIGTHGFEGLEPELERAAATLRERFAFFEVILIGSTGDGPMHGLVQRLGRDTPQIRVLQIEGAVDFDRMAMHGYQECIGDIVVLSSADEIGDVNLYTVIEHLRAGKEIVRLRRHKASALERASSFVVRFVTGLNVDTRFLRTLGLNRQILSELLARPEEIHLFRFTAQTLFAQQTVIEVDHMPTRSGLQLLLRRVDLVLRLVATSAPRLLRMSSALCLVLALVALLTLVYVLAVWLFREEVAPGWATMVSLLALWMFVQLSATSTLCLGLSRVLNRQERARMPRLVDEIIVSDLFSSSGLLNVENAHDDAGPTIPALSVGRY